MLMLRSRIPALAGAALLTVGAVVLAQGPGGLPPVPGKSLPAQGTSGVITKVEHLTADAGAAPVAPHRVRLTINTNANWADYARDMADVPVDASLERVAAEGNNSVATRGQPAAEDAVVELVVGPETRLDTRFRSATNVASPGAETAAGAVAEERDPAAPVDDTRRLAARPAPIDPMDLKPGLFVEFQYQPAGNQNQATQVVVLRPVAESQAPAPEPRPEAAQPKEEPPPPPAPAPAEAAPKEEAPKDEPAPKDERR